MWLREIWESTLVRTTEIFVSAAEFSTRLELVCDPSCSFRSQNVTCVYSAAVRSCVWVQVCLCEFVCVCVIWQLVRTTPPWPTGDNGADNFSADRAKRFSFGAWQCLIRCPDKPLGEQTGSVLSLASCFNNSHFFWKCSRPFKQPKTRPRLLPRNKTQANCFTSSFENVSVRRSERKGCLALSQTLKQGCREYWSPLMAAKCAWKRVVTTSSMPIV